MTLPADDSLLVRTDFRSDVAWRALCALVRQPVGEMQAFVRCIDDRDLERATIERLAAAFTPSGQSGQSFLFVADATTFEHPEQPLLVVDLLEAPHRTFRVVPRAAWCVQNNLPLGNMDFDELAAAADSAGILRELVKRWSRRELEAVPLSEAACTPRKRRRGPCSPPNGASKESTRSRCAIPTATGIRSSNRCGTGRSERGTALRVGAHRRARRARSPRGNRYLHAPRAGPLLAPPPGQGEPL